MAFAMEQFATLEMIKFFSNVGVQMKLCKNLQTRSKLNKNAANKIVTQRDSIVNRNDAHRMNGDSMSDDELVANDYDSEDDHDSDEDDDSDDDDIS